MKFTELNLIKPILKAIAKKGYDNPTPIQAKTIPSVLAGQDVLASAQTGTGKTAAFALPLLNRMATKTLSGKPKPRCLVLCPTRELAKQIEDNFTAYSKYIDLKQVVIFGGVKQARQVRALSRGVHTIIATPGRLLDLINQGHVNLKEIETFILDEADRMLDMGFIPDIRRIVTKLPAKRQTLLFSATLPNNIRKLSKELLKNPHVIDIAPQAPAAKAIDQSIYFVPKDKKPKLLTELLTGWNITRGLIFTRTKHGADRLVKQLQKNSIEAKAIHGNKSQNARERTLKQFKDGKINILVATDIASRGIDVDDISHVINFDLTNEPETYIHRIGRTARAGASGIAVSFCSKEERKNLKNIEKLLGNSITIAPNQLEYNEQTQNKKSSPSKSRRSKIRKPGRQNKKPDIKSSNNSNRKQKNLRENNAKARKNKNRPGKNRRLAKPQVS